MKKTILIFSVAVLASSPGGTKAGSNVHWGYEGNEGPQQRGNLSESYEMCKKGRNQSPIDIKKGSITELDGIEFNYQGSSLTVLNNGHTIQVNAGSGAYINVGGEKYDLLQYHFHSPNEHQVKGAPYLLEMHLVHKSEHGRLAVIGILMKKGEYNAELKKIWDYMPGQAGEKISPNISVDPASLLPDNRSYFYYNGSLTTPPCSEGVRWFVLSSPVEIAQSQAQGFLDIMHHVNARPP